MQKKTRTGVANLRRNFCAKESCEVFTLVEALAEDVVNTQFSEIEPSKIRSGSDPELLQKELAESTLIGFSEPEEKVSEFEDKFKCNFHFFGVVTHPLILMIGSVVETLFSETFKIIVVSSPKIAEECTDTLLPKVTVNVPLFCKSKSPTCNFSFSFTANSLTGSLNKMSQIGSEQYSTESPLHREIINIFPPEKNGAKF